MSQIEGNSKLRGRGKLLPPYGIYMHFNFTVLYILWQKCTLVIKCTNLTHDNYMQLAIKLQKPLCVDLKL